MGAIGEQGVPTRAKAGVRVSMVERIVSGGQTGVDRAALDAAMEADVPCGGWCPRGRRAEDGVIPARYPLRETPGAGTIERTEANVRDSDATLVLCFGPAAGGTRATIACAQSAGKPVLVVDLNDDERSRARHARIRRWLDATAVGTLNIAGPRESEHPGAYAGARAVVREVIAGFLKNDAVPVI